MILGEMLPILSSHEMPQTAQNLILCPDTQRICPKLPRRGA